MPICLRLFWHWVREAASRTFCTAGSKRPIKTAMMAITTSSSIKVKAVRLGRVVLIAGTSGWNRMGQNFPGVERTALGSRSWVQFQHVRPLLRLIDDFHGHIAGANGE